MYKSAVCITARMEEAYIQECILHNYIVGFDKMIIVLHQLSANDNDRTHEKILQLPDNVLEKVVVETITTDCLYGYQPDAYHKIYDEWKDKVEWLAMFDVDECLYDSKRRSVNELLSGIPDHAGQVLIPWLNFGHSGRVLSATPQETRYTAFTKCEGYANVNAQIKPIVRTKDIITDSRWYWTHFASTKGAAVDVSGNVLLDGQITGEEQFYRDIRKNFTNFDTCLVHYFTGAMEDWVIRYKRRKNHVYYGEHSVNMFMENTYEIEDTRMSIYLDGLKGLLEKCKN